MPASESFATARDETRIWWRSLGRGSPALVLTDGIACSGFIWKHLAPAIAAHRRVVHWNYRGHGRSQRPRDPRRISIFDCVDDLLAVLDAAGERSAVLAGHSMGVQVCLEAHRADPARVAALVLVCGSPGHPLDTFHDRRILARAFPTLRDLVLRWPGPASRLFHALVPTELAYQVALLFEVNGRRVHREDFFPYLEEVADMDLELFVRMLTTAAAHDASDHLASIDVPTLVVAGARDTWTPLWLSDRMHEAIRSSEILRLSGGTHVAPIEYPGLVASRVEKVLRKRVPVRAAGSPADGAGDHPVPPPPRAAG